MTVVEQSQQQVVDDLQPMTVVEQSQQQVVDDLPPQLNPAYITTTSCR